MIKEYSFLPFYGFNNPGTCVFSFYSSKNNKQCGIDILPLCFWKHFYFYHDTFYDGVKRINFGCGLFSFFFDYGKSYE